MHSTAQEGTGMAQARCRFCDERVEAFGDVCSDCEGSDDTLLRIARDDAFALMDAEPDYGGAFDGFVVTSDADPGL